MKILKLIPWIPLVGMIAVLLTLTYFIGVSMSGRDIQLPDPFGFSEMSPFRYWGSMIIQIISTVLLVTYLGT